MATSKSLRESKKLVTYIRKTLKNYPDFKILGPGAVDWYAAKFEIVDLRHRRIGEDYFASFFEVAFCPPMMGETWTFVYDDKKLKLYQIARMIIKAREGGK